MQQLNRVTSLILHLRLQIRLLGPEEGKGKHRSEAPGDVLLLSIQFALRHGIHTQLFPLDESTNHCGRRLHKLSIQREEVRSDETLNLGESHVPENDLTHEVEASTARPTAHLPVHETVEVEGVAAEDGGLAWHVNSKGERLCGKYNRQKTATEENLNCITIDFFGAWMVQANTPTKSSDQFLFGSLVLEVTHDFLNVFLPLSERLRAVEGKFRVDFIGKVHGWSWWVGDDVVPGLVRFHLRRSPSFVISRVLPRRFGLLILARLHLDRFLVEFQLGSILSLALLHDLLGPVLRLFISEVLLMLSIFQLLQQSGQHHSDLGRREIENDCGELAGLMECRTQGEERRGLQVGSASAQLRHIHTELLRLSSILVFNGIELLALLQANSETAKTLLRKHVFVDKLKVGRLQILLVLARFGLRDEAATVFEIHTRRELVPQLRRTNESPNLLKERDHLLWSQRHVRGEAVTTH
mmetsp:Transcript_45615/g.121002  ORF Transcript_45615/g.121002 Transcript_45615/m.121002 type:complete len:469 (-) Transcript_45615:2669-4075(-)